MYKPLKQSGRYGEHNISQRGRANIGISQAANANVKFIQVDFVIIGISQEDICNFDIWETQKSEPVDIENTTKDVSQGEIQYWHESGNRGQYWNHWGWHEQN